MSTSTVKKPYERHVGSEKRLRRKDRQRTQFHRARKGRPAWLNAREKGHRRGPSRALKSMYFTNQSRRAVRHARILSVGHASRPVKTMVFSKMSKLEFVGGFRGEHHARKRSKLCRFCNDLARNDAKTYLKKVGSTLQREMRF